MGVDVLMGVDVPMRMDDVEEQLARLMRMDDGEEQLTCR